MAWIACFVIRAFVILVSSFEFKPKPMHPKFLPLLCCPDTGESFTLEARVTLENGMVYAGALKTESGRSYPIVRGVPRFVERQDYSASFGWEWARWPRVQFESENVGRPMAGHTTKMWDRITGFGSSIGAGELDSPEPLRGKRVCCCS